MCDCKSGQKCQKLKRKKSKKEAARIKVGQYGCGACGRGLQLGSSSRAHFRLPSMCDWKSGQRCQKLKRKKSQKEAARINVGQYGCGACGLQLVSSSRAHFELPFQRRPISYLWDSWIIHNHRSIFEFYNWSVFAISAFFVVSWVEKATRLCISNDIWILSSDTICQLNQILSNSEAAMLFTVD